MRVTRQPARPAATDDTPAARLRALKPRDAATLIVIDRSLREPRMLMGRRSAGQVFLPGKYVFPGGRVESCDRAVTPATPLPAEDEALLLAGLTGRPSPGRARALALAAIRETFEETGFVIGEPGRPPAPPMATGSEQRPHQPWTPYFETGFVPALEGLTYVARAITPPGRPRRYDTRFFVVDADRIARRLDRPDGELEDLVWVSLAEARNLDLAGITRIILEDVATLEDRPRDPGQRRVLPHYFHRRGAFQRALLSLPPP